VVIAIIPAPAGLSPHAWRYFAVFAAVISALVVEPLPSAAIGLLGVTLVTTLSRWVLFSPAELARPGFSPGAEALQCALSGFSNGTVWLVFGAFMFALGYEKTGLGRRVALVLVRAMGESTLALGYATALADAVLAPFTPSNTRGDDRGRMAPPGSYGSSGVHSGGRTVRDLEAGGTMRLRWTHLLFATVGLTVSGHAQYVEVLPPYKPGPSISGKIVAWGNPEQQKVWEGWAEGFRKFQPRVTMEGNLKSSAHIAGALYTGVANVGIAGRDIMPLEVLAYKTMFNRDVFQLVHGSGSFDVPKQTSAVGIFVHKDNPLTRLTLTQVDAIFSRERRRGAPESIRRWGQLGLTGEWADKPIHLYAPTISFPATAVFFEHVVFNGGTRWNCDITEFDSSDKLVEALANDRHGIAIVSFSNRTPMVKALALAATDGGPYIEGSKETVWKRTYPLTRNIYLWVNRDPQKGFDPVVREFLRYVLSREGQTAVLSGQYVPLNPEKLQEELRKVD
jgi:phosphate transport system substrate-binding protein